jgi:hypothetical protein
LLLEPALLVLHLLDLAVHLPQLVFGAIEPHHQSAGILRAFVGGAGPGDVGGRPAIELRHSQPILAFGDAGLERLDARGRARRGVLGEGRRNRRGGDRRDKQDTFHGRCRLVSPWTPDRTIAAHFGQISAPTRRGRGASRHVKHIYEASTIG